jgi:peptidoglycan/xylan/chitin deacetylase (PgdA/CDA1 family)
MGATPSCWRGSTRTRALSEIRALYDRELEKIFGQVQTRGIAVRREAWESYVAFVKSLYTREAILKEYADVLGSISEGTRSKEVVRKAGPLEITGFKLPKKTLVLTFDDGPDPLYTPAVLDILEKYQVRSIFFEVGSHAGKVEKDAKGKEQIAPTRAAEATRRLLASGHVLGNHTYSHALLTKLKDDRLASW